MLDSIYFEISESIYGNVCPKSEGVWFKKRGKKKGPSHLHVWPGLACSAVLFSPRLLLPVLWNFPWCEATPWLLLHQTGEPWPHTCQSHLLPPAGLAALGPETAQDCSLVSQFYGLQAVNWHCFIGLWPLPGFQLCCLIIGYRDQSVCTSACIWSHGRVSSG